MLLNTTALAKVDFISYFVFGRGVQSYPCCPKLPHNTVVQVNTRSLPGKSSSLVGIYTQHTNK